MGKLSLPLTSTVEKSELSTCLGHTVELALIAGFVGDQTLTV